jgi:hypothetical protein
MKWLALGIACLALPACAHVSRSKQQQVQTSFNQTTAPIKYGAMQRAAAASR